MYNKKNIYHKYIFNVGTFCRRNFTIKNISQNQNKLHKIHIVVTTELLEYVFENDFEIRHSSQEGKYGIILHVIDKKTGKNVVLKKMKRYVKMKVYIQIRLEIGVNVIYLLLISKFIISFPS